MDNLRWLSEGDKVEISFGACPMIKELIVEVSLGVQCLPVYLIKDDKGGVHQVMLYLRMTRLEK